MKVTLNVDKIFHLRGKLSITKQTLFKQSILFSFKTITFIESIIQNYPFKEILNSTRSKKLQGRNLRSQVARAIYFSKNGTALNRDRFQWGREGWRRNSSAFFFTGNSWNTINGQSSFRSGELDGGGSLALMNHSSLIRRWAFGS